MAVLVLVMAVLFPVLMLVFLLMMQAVEEKTLGRKRESVEEWLQHASPGEIEAYVRREMRNAVEEHWKSVGYVPSSAGSRDVLEADTGELRVLDPEPDMA